MEGRICELFGGYYGGLRIAWAPEQITNGNGYPEHVALHTPADATEVYEFTAVSGRQGCSGLTYVAEYKHVGSARPTESDLA